MLFLKTYLKKRHRNVKVKGFRRYGRGILREFWRS
jgi:hypothetical protein